MRNLGLGTLVCWLASLGKVLGQTRGVNLGGWLVTEEWIVPSVYASTGAPDEWHLCNELGKNACLTTLQAHWSTFYTRSDFVDIKAAGLNTLRIPVGYWAVDLLDYEPYVSGQYPYLIQAVQWAKELNLQVMISLHGAPGSQNGQSGSGLIGPVLFATNTSNIDRSLNVLKNLTEEFSQQDVYGDTVTSIELLNEPSIGATFSTQQLKSFYTEGLSTLHNVSSTMNASLSDAWFGASYWSNWVSSNAASAPITMDIHNFYAFAPKLQYDQDDILEDLCNLSVSLRQPSSSSGIPTVVIGEWSLQTGVNATGATPSSREWLRLLFEAQARAYTPTGPGQPLTGWIFWSWKTEDDINTWSYRRGIAQGYILADVTNSSQYVYPLLENGCVDSTYNYTAPATVPTYNAPDYTKKSSATSLERLSSWSLIPAALALVWPLCLS